MIVELREHGTASVALSDIVARRLATVAGAAIDVAPDRRQGHWKLSANQYVGSIAVDDLQVLIRPKIRAENLFLFLGAGMPASAWRSEAFDYGTSHDLLPAVLSFFARTVETTLGRGVLRSYRSYDERLVALRGRIDVGRQIRRGGPATPVACRFDDFTADVDENRYLKAAIRRALRSSRFPHQDRRRLLHAVGALDDVAEAVTPRWEDLRTSRLNAHYRPVLRLARLVMENLSLVDVRGAHAACAFLLDMNALFERFVTERLEVELRGRMRVRSQTSRALDDAGRVPLRPDLEFHRGEVPALVGDIKYKVTDDARPRREDYYQLLAYTVALGLPAGLLVYCRTSGGALHSAVRVADLGTVLHVRAIDASGSPGEVAQELAELADWIVDHS